MCLDYQSMPRTKRPMANNTPGRNSGSETSAIQLIQSPIAK
jgi:hypothetical protein